MTQASTEAAEQLVNAARDRERQILLRGVCLVSLDQKVGDFERASILIRGRHIAAIAPDIPVDPASTLVIECDGHIAIPGLHDTHRHCWQTQFRRMFVDSSLDQYAVTMHGQIAPHYQPSDSRLGNLLAGLGALDSGITCVLDFSHNTRSPDHADALIAGLMESGIRAVHAQCGPVLGPWDRQWPKDLERLLATHFSSDDQLVTLRLGATAPLPDGVASELQVTEELLAYARRLGLKISVDAVSGPGASRRIEELGQVDALGPDITFIHCLGLTPQVWAQMSSSGCHVSLAPSSDANLGAGEAITPIQAALDFGLLPALGGDVECCLTTDLFSQMQAAMTIQRMFAYNARNAGSGSAPSPVSARQVLEFATTAGAAANGLSGKVGTLTPGKEADIVLIDAASPRTMPLNSAIGAIVMGTDSSSVSGVIVAGEARKWGGKLLGIDLDHLRRQVTASRDRLLVDSKLERNLFA